MSQVPQKDNAVRKNYKFIICTVVCIMELVMKKLALSLACLGCLFFTPTVFAHEAYVLTADQFNRGLLLYTQNPFQPLLDPAHTGISAVITICVILAYLLVTLFSATGMASFLDRLVRNFSEWGPVVIRVSVGIALFYAAQANVILGPELPLTKIAGGELIRFGLFALSFMITFGVLTEVASLAALLILLYIIFYFKQYMITYVNYYAEFFVLTLFGSRFLSVDRISLGKKLWNRALEKAKDMEVPIVRWCYGIALAYAGWNIKFVHQSLSVEVYNQYHLVNFFHAGASFIASGAGLSEILIGVFIFLGFATRFTVLISLVFITLSLLYFQEMLWPHLVLYGISINLLINSTDKFSLQSYLIPWVRSWFGRGKR